MSSADFAIQSAIYSALSADATLTAITSNIVDFGPSQDDASLIYPYVAIGAIVASSFDSDNKDGFDYVARLHTWSNTGSAKQTKDIQSAIYGALHRVSLTVTSWNNFLIYRDSSFVERSSSGAFHGVCEYRGLISRN